MWFDFSRLFTPPSVTDYTLCTVICEYFEINYNVLRCLISILMSAKQSLNKNWKYIITGYFTSITKRLLTSLVFDYIAINETFVHVTNRKHPLNLESLYSQPLSSVYCAIFTSVLWKSQWSSGTCVLIRPLCAIVSSSSCPLWRTPGRDS